MLGGNQKIGAVALLAIACFAALARGDITDTLNDTSYLTATLNSTVIANGDGTVSMMRTAGSDSVVDWRSSSRIALQLENDRLEIVPATPVNGGQYSIWLLFYNSSQQFLGEYQCIAATQSTSVQVLPSISQFAAQNGIDIASIVSGNVKYYVRFRIHNNSGEGFKFDEIRVREGPGYWKTASLMQGAPKAVFGHEMTGWHTTQYSGHWGGWNYSNSFKSHNPDNKDANGLPDIASVYYPSVGYYDMCDVNLAEYHCQMMKMAGIDGMVFDLGFYSLDTETVTAMTRYLSVMARYNLKAVICYEDKSHWIWPDGTTTRAQAVAAAYADMNNWLALFLASGQQYDVNGSRPLFLLFSYEQTTSKGTSCLSPSELTTWLNNFSSANRPVLMRQSFKNPDHVGVLNGQFDWVEIKSPAPSEMSPYVSYSSLTDTTASLRYDRRWGQYLLGNNKEDFHISGAWPGFDDIEVWGWGGGPRLVPRFDGDTYNLTWQWILADALPAVQISTWNDWYEGTNIEPSVEFGSKYLEMTRNYAAQFKSQESSTDVDFNVPVWIYKIRNVVNDPCVLADMNEASVCIDDGNYTQAQELVQPWVQYLGIDSIKYWTGSSSMNLAAELSVEPNMLDFTTPVRIGTSMSLPLQLRNIGKNMLHFNGSHPIIILQEQNDFSLVQPVNTSDLSIAHTRDITIRFTPISTGTRTGTLRIITNDPLHPITDVPLSGVGCLYDGDLNLDNVIDFLDFAILGQGWGQTYSWDMLTAICSNWLSGK